MESHDVAPSGLGTFAPPPKGAGAEPNPERNSPGEPNRLVSQASSGREEPSTGTAASVRSIYVWCDLTDPLTEDRAEVNSRDSEDS